MKMGNALQFYRGRQSCGWLVLIWLGLVCPMVYGLDESRLWLPVTYKHYYFELLASGLAAEAQRECESVVEGTTDLDRSKPDHPVFRMLCRNPDGRTFNVLVDGLTRSIITPGYEIDQLLTSEQRAERVRRREQEEERRQRQLAAEKARQYEVLKERYWTQCEQAMQSTMDNMLSMEWLEDPRAPAITVEGAAFARNFTARDFSGNKLFFTVECKVTADGSADAVILPTARVDNRF